jgi:prolyl oligopeptidase
MGSSTDTKAAYKVYYKARKAADNALKARRYKDSRAHYLNGVKALEAEFEDSDNRLCALYAGAGNAAYCAEKVMQALRDFEKALEHLHKDEQVFIDMLRYIVEALARLAIRLKNENQRTMLNKLVIKITRRFQKALIAIPPQSAAKTYILNRKRIKDPFSSLESIADEGKAREWLDKQSLLSRVKMLKFIVDFKKPREFYGAGYAQMEQLPKQAGDYYFFYSYDHSGYTNIKRASALNKRAHSVFKGQKYCPVDGWITGTILHSNGQYLAFGTTTNGSDFETWKVFDIDSGTLLDDEITGVPSGSIFFDRKKAGLIYRRSRKEGSGSVKRSAFYYHKIGTKISTDKPVYVPPAGSAEWTDIYMLLKSKFVLVSEWPADSFHNSIAIKSLKGKKAVKLFPRKAGTYTVVGESHGKLFFTTDHNAPRGKVIAVTYDYAKEKVLLVEEVIPETGNTIIEARLLQNALLIHTLDKEGKTQLLRYTLGAKATTPQSEIIPLPFDGTLSELSTNYRSDDIFFSLENFAVPTTIYHHNLNSRKTVIFARPKYSLARRVTQRMVQVKSKDGTMIPMVIAHKKDLALNGKNPTLVNVYGGFSIAMFPHFSYQIASWIALGGVWAQPYVRGGDELGSDWHMDAIKSNKQKTYDDTAYSARWLIENKYTRRDKLALSGGSNGGLTVGAVITQHPELCAAAIVENGLFDMLKFSQHGLGWAWQSEYGSIKKPDEFKALRAYSPYHRLVEAKKRFAGFPSVLVNVSACDDRVVPWHSYKFAAALATVTDCNLFLNIKDNQGHGAGRPDWTVRDNLAFLKWALNF